MAGLCDAVRRWWRRTMGGATGERPGNPFPKGQLQGERRGRMLRLGQVLAKQLGPEASSKEITRLAAGGTTARDATAQDWRRWPSAGHVRKSSAARRTT